MRTKSEVKIIIPIYKKNLSVNDYISLDRCYEMLHQYPIVIVKPDHLNISFLHERYNGILVESFSDSFFDSVDSYNRFMLSPDFYERFLDSKYILIHQTDVFIFKDTLKEWCDKNYDYIGAPWVLRPVYKRFPINIVCYLKKVYCSYRQLPNRQKIFFKVGNGGLSLRKTSSHYKISKQDRRTIEYYLAMRNQAHCFNEDVYWSIEAPKFDTNFKIPDYKEALDFSIDKYPKLCYRLNRSQLPFGCHAWPKKKMFRFWKTILESIINKKISITK